MTHLKEHQPAVVQPHVHSHVKAEDPAPVVKKRHYVRVKDKPDPRDHRFRLAAPISLPDQIDLSPGCSPIEDQGDLNSCTGHAVAAALEYDENTQGENRLRLSRLFIYYNERLMEGDVNQDEGAEIRDGIKTIAQYGACDETLWPYDIKQVLTKPSDAAYANGLLHKGLTYQAVDQTEVGICSALASGFPIVFGVTVYDSFETEEALNTGVIPMPDTQKEQCQGGHAVLLVGYDKTKQVFKFRNSWGTDCGLPDQRGYFTLPYEFVLDRELSSDFWVVSKIS